MLNHSSNSFTAIAALVLGFLLSVANTVSHAAEPVKIGLVLPMSGAFSSYGKQIERGVRLYLQENGDVFAGRKVEILIKDDTGVAPELTKRATQELLVRDRVDILGGYGMTPGAMASAPLATEAKTPMVVMNAGASILPSRSPFIVRTSADLAHYTRPLGPWSVRQGLKRAFTLVADFSPGHDTERYFSESYSAAGGEIIDTLRVPPQNVDYAPYLQRIKDAKPDVLFVFVQAGEAVTALLKGFRERGLADAGIRLVATGDLTNEDTLAALGDAALGVVTAHHYSEAHDSPENRAYVQAYTRRFKSERPNFMSVAGYDGMRLIHETLKKTGGQAGEAFMQAVRGLSFTSPRGRVTVNPQTRDFDQTIYIREVVQENSGGKTRLVNKEIDATLATP